MATHQRQAGLVAGAGNNVSSQGLRAFRLDVDLLVRALVTETGPISAPSNRLEAVHNKLADWRCREGQREAYLHGHEYLIQSGAWGLLLKRLRWNSEQLLAMRVPALAALTRMGGDLSVVSREGAELNMSLAGGGPGHGDLSPPISTSSSCGGRGARCARGYGGQPTPAAPAASTAVTSESVEAAASGALRVHVLASRLLHEVLQAADEEASALVPSGALPPHMNIMHHAVLALVASHGLRDLSRLAAQAAGAASDAAAATGDGGDGGDSSGGSSSSSAAGAASSGSGRASQLRPLLAELLASTCSALRHVSKFSRCVSSVDPKLTCSYAASIAGSPGRGGGDSGRGSSGRTWGRTCGGVGSVGCGSSTGGGGGGAGAAHPSLGQPLLGLVLSEIGISGFLEQVARLTLHDAQAVGRRRLQLQPHLLGQAQSGRQQDVRGALPSALPALAAAVLHLTQEVTKTAKTWARQQAAAVRAGISSSTSSNTSSDSTSSTSSSSSSGSSGTNSRATTSSTRAGGSVSAHQKQAPLLWGICLRTLALSQVVVTLGAAGFGGGAGGMWGLPANLAAGLPLLGEPPSPGQPEPDLWALRPRGAVVYLSAMPFTTLCGILTSGEPCWDVRSSAAGSSAAGSSSSSRQPQVVGGGPFPVSPRALTEVLLAVADLAVASLPGPAPVSAAVVGQPQLLRLDPVDAWGVMLAATPRARGALLLSGPEPQPGGDSANSSNGGRQLSLRYWRTAAAVLRCWAAGFVDTRGYAAFTGAFKPWVALTLALEEVEPTGSVLATRPPHVLAAPLAAGMLGALEAVLRAAPDTELAMAPISTFLQLSTDTYQCGNRWPLFQQLLAFAPPAQAAALVTSIAKRLHAALDGASVNASVSTRKFLAVASSVLPPPYFDNETSPQQPNASHGEPLLARKLRLRLLYSHTLHRWLPALSRCLRRPQLQSEELAALAVPYAQTMQLLLPVCLEVMLREGECTVTSTTAGSAAAASSSSGAGISSAATSSTRAAATASAAASVVSWRQWLVHEVDVVGLTEMGLRLLAALPPGAPAAHEVLVVVHNSLRHVPMTVPAALPATPPWLPDTLRNTLLPHMAAVGMPEEDLEEPLSLVELLQMTPAVRVPALYRSLLLARAKREHVIRLKEALVPRSEPWRVPLSPYETARGADTLAPIPAPAAAPAGNSGGGSSSISSSSSVGSSTGPPGVLPGPGHALSCCASPRCIALGGGSEADLPLQACGACRCVWYCGQTCQRAHWRAGHKVACVKLQAASAAKAVTMAAAAGPAEVAASAGGAQQAVRFTIDDLD